MQEFTRPLTRGIGALLLSGAMALGAVGLCAWPGTAEAQNLFAPRLYVNGQVITEFEVQQRANFMRALRVPGDPEKEALDALINERLQREVAKRFDIRLTEEEITAAMREFAARAELTPEQFVAELQRVGISAETFRDFASAGALWRKVVRARYLGTVPVTENEVDRALDAMTRPRDLKARLSELVLIAEPGREEEVMALAEDLSRRISSEAEFAQAARNYSAAESAARGGVVPEWIQLSNLPPAVSQQLLTLGRGKASSPLVVPNAVVLFMVRDIAPDEKAAPIRVEVEWAEYVMPNDPEAIGRVITRSSNCNEFYGQAKGAPEQLTIRKAPLAEVPKDVALELAKLDINEISTSATPGGNRRLTMLCARKPIFEQEPSRDQIKEQIIGQKLEGLANAYMEELRAGALIRQP